MFEKNSKICGKPFKTVNSRNNAPKKNIKKFLGDDNIDLNNTETKIMQEHGFV